MSGSWLEKQRLKALRNLGILDTPPEERFEKLTKIARRFYNVEIAMFTLVDEHRQWFKSKQGLDVDETPRSMAFCDHTIQQDKILIVEDAQNDPRFHDNPLVTGSPHIRFYAGMPVREPSGFKIGTLCIIDPEPRAVAEFELDVLRTLASLVEDELENAYVRGEDHEYVKISELSRSIHRAQNIFLTHEDQGAAFELMLNDLLVLTSSQFGFIGEVLHHANGDPYLKVGAITNLAWNAETEALYQQVQRRGMTFENLDNLIGSSLLSGEIVVSNEFAADPRRGGLPDGHPTISSYIGVPIFSGDAHIGLVGLANRPTPYSDKIAHELEPLLQTVGQLIERKRLFQEKMEHARKLERAANYDALTGLPNRSRLTELFEQELLEADKRSGSVSVCFLDLDGFKDINDNHGHSVGDYALKTIADRLSNSIREHDIVSRLGGDEFVAILRDVDSHQVYERMLKAIREPIQFGQFRFELSGSMGVTVYPGDDADSDMLMRHADQAMYAAKESGKNQFQIFDLETHVTRKERVKILEQIPEALQKRQLELFLQPKINIEQQSVLGFEALIRWNHPEEGLLTPVQFLPHLEYTEYAIAVGRFVLNEAVRFLRYWQDHGVSCSISVNLSPSHFLSDHFLGDLAGSIAGLDEAMRSRLILEILETTALDDARSVIRLLTECRALGVEVSMDDFGTGYSSLDYFRKLPADEIKIDRSFVTDMLQDPDDEMIVGAIIGLSKHFRRRVIAEGIENKATADKLLQLGCVIGQGYYFARPMPFSEAMAWAEDFKAKRRCR